MHDHDPLFEPIGSDQAQQQSSSQGATQSGPNSPKTSGGPFVKSSGPPGLGGIGGISGIASSLNPTILVLRDAMGGMGFVGPFPDEDLALDYVKMHGLNGIYWVLVTELQSP